ncbi:MAG: hypothetical protein J6A37_02190 [Oscillospiraceae bacterium]|nr:hypothetical protein [Oscillospiraceae bacterium]
MLSISINNPELPPESLSEKFSRLDLSLTVDNRLVNVEASALKKFK